MSDKLKRAIIENRRRTEQERRRDIVQAHARRQQELIMNARTMMFAMASDADLDAYYEQVRRTHGPGIAAYVRDESERLGRCSRAEAQEVAMRLASSMAKRVN